MTPICPKCGSVAVKRALDRKHMFCTRCHHRARRSAFMKGGPATRFHVPNQHWRDPVAMCMGGYEDNGE